MKRYISFFGMTILCLSTFTGISQAQTVASPASPARPSGLGIFGPVYQNGSDARSANFQANVLPEFMAIINDRLAETVEFTGRTGFKLDPAKLFLRTQADQPIRVYFISEGAGYKNSLGFCWTQAGSDSSQTPTLLFPNASLGTGKSRTTDEPLRTFFKNYDHVVVCRITTFY